MDPSEINLTNVLGHQGKIANNYAKVIYHLWIEDKNSYAPMQFKRIISELNEMVNYHFK